MNTFRLLVLAAITCASAAIVLLVSGDPLPGMLVGAAAITEALGAIHARRSPVRSTNQA